MRTHIILSHENGKDIPIRPSDLALSSSLIGSNYPCLELIFMVPQVFEPLKFDCIEVAPAHPYPLAPLPLMPNTVLYNSEVAPHLTKDSC